MKKLFTSLLLTLILTLMLRPTSEVEAWAGINSVSGNVVVKETGAGIPNVWVKWEESRDESTSDWPSEPGRGTKYVKTDSSGKFTFPYWYNPVSLSEEGQPLLYENFNYRVRDYLTWIKPDQPNVAPDTNAYDNIYLPAISTLKPGANIVNEAFFGALNTTKQAAVYKPAGSGWVRKASTAYADAFQCNNQPIISVIMPSNWDGTLENGGRFPLPYVANGTSPISLGTISFSTNKPFPPVDIPSTPNPVQSSAPGGSNAPASSALPTTPPGVVSTISPNVDIWAESGVLVTGRGSSGGTMRVDPGQPFTLFWTAANASTCVASGSWAGIKQAGTTRLSKPIPNPIASQTYNYTLTCFNNTSGAQESDSVIIQVNQTRQAPFIQTTEGDVHSNEDINVPNP